MPITFTLDPEQRAIRTAIRGPVTFADVQAHVDALVAANALGYPDLVDASAATGPGLFSGDIGRLAQRMGSLRQDFTIGPRAIVVTSNAAYGMVRMLAVLASAWVTLEVFRDRGQAEAWLRGFAGRPGA
ncbi:MAG TPA: hypothetical protein VGG65_07565 [Thermoanaerobaculia bacterium]